jgi:general stress protein CsbA
MKDLPDVTTKGGTLYVFALPFGGALAVVAADVTLRRAVALALTLLFLDAAVCRR